MIEQIHSIAGQSVGPPANRDELNIVLNYDNDNPQGTSQVSIKSFRWVDDEARKLYEILNAGLTGGPGVMEGVKHLITVQDPAYNIKKEFKNIIDLRTATFDLNEVTADSMPEAQLDWLNEVADSFTFEYLYSIGKITRDDFYYVPYVISANPNYREAFLVLLTLTVITIQVQEIVSEIQAEIAEVATLISTVGGVIRLVFRIAYCVLLFLTILELILDLIALIIQKVKYVPGMFVNDLIRIGADHLGLTYQSDRLMSPVNEKMFILPQSYDQVVNSEDSRIRGIFDTNESDQRGYYIGTFGQLLRDIKIATGTKVLVSDDRILNIVPDFVPPSSAAVKMDANTTRYVDQLAFRTNGSELVANINITFQPDTTDKNTLDNWTGTNVDVAIRPITVNDKANVLLSGGRLISIPFARASRKEKLTVPESICQVLLEILQAPLNLVIEVVNIFTGTLNIILKSINKVIDALDFIGIDVQFELPEIKKIPKLNIDNLIEDRIGMLLLEADYFTVPKLFLLDVGSKPRKNKINENNHTIIAARYIYENYYRGINTQYLRRTFRNIELNMFDVLNLIVDQAITIPNGTVSKLISCDWNEKQRVAEIVVDEPYIYCNNLKEVINEPLGR
jgi:hypothetical protein